VRSRRRSAGCPSPPPPPPPGLWPPRHRERTGRTGRPRRTWPTSRLVSRQFNPPRDTR
jgi:hypothetical protein